MAQALVRCHSRLNINWSIKFWFFIIVVGIFLFKIVSRTRSSQDTSPTSTCRAATCTTVRNRAVLPSFFPRLFCTTRLLRGCQGFYSSCACQHVRTCALVAFALTSSGTLFQKLSLPLFLCQLCHPARAQSARARRACALRALGLLLADGAPTVGRGKTFWHVSRIFLRKQL